MKETNLSSISSESRTLDDEHIDNEIEVNNDDYSNKINDTNSNLNDINIEDEVNINEDNQI